MITAKSIILLNEKDIVSVTKGIAETTSGNRNYRISILYKFGKVVQEVITDYSYESARDTDYEHILKCLKKLNTNVLSE